jgi:hypothetical protein
MVDLFAKVFPSAVTGVWTPDDWLDQSDPDPMLTVIRLPGGEVDYDMNYDECLGQFTATTTDRGLSNRMISVVRAVLLPMQGFKFTMGDGFTAQIHKVSEVSGPQMLTGEQQIDTRVVPATFRIRVGLRSRKRYHDIISGL